MLEGSQETLKEIITGKLRTPMTSSLVNNTLRGTGSTLPITFTHEDTVGVHYSHCDALVVKAIVAKNGFNCMLVDNGSYVKILFGAAYDKMLTGHELTPHDYPHMVLLVIASFLGEELC